MPDPIVLPRLSLLSLHFELVVHPRGDHTRPRKQATPSRRPYGAQKTGHTPRQPYGVQETYHASMAAICGLGTSQALPAYIRGPRDWPRLHGSLTCRRKPATPLRRPYKAQKTGHAQTATVRSPGDRPHLHGSHMGSGDLPGTRQP